MAIQEMLQNDPRTQQVMAFINQNGGNPQEVFYQEAHRKGVDPNTYIAQVNSILNNR